MEIFYVLTKYVQSRLLQNCRLRERVMYTTCWKKQLNKTTLPCPSLNSHIPYSICQSKCRTNTPNQYINFLMNIICFKKHSNKTIEPCSLSAFLHTVLHLPLEMQNAPNPNQPFPYTRFAAKTIEDKYFNPVRSEFMQLFLFYAIWFLTSS